MANQIRQRATGRGLGKLIVLGEHSVVYGHRALAAAVSLGTTVALTRRPGPTALGASQVQDERLGRALAAALPAEGVRVDITTELPVGRGMGSSAALTVALLRAAAALAGEALTPEALHERGFAIERVFHGNPSGLDHAVAARGGALVYRKGEPPEVVAMPPTEIIVLDSGVAGDTAALVAGVASRRPAIDPHLDRLGMLVEQALPLLADIEALGAVMNEAHEHLRAVGVSTPRLDELVALAREAGSPGAKLSGAGGGGVVIALAGGAGWSILAAARAAGVHAFSCTLPGI
jgi:mevalonate kinase